jgi:thiol-disulfide isomerase/thioredoxin
MIRIISLILILFLFSCSNEKGEKNQIESNPSKNHGATELSKIDVPLLDKGVFESILEENKGKVLFINTWATWCVPCKEEFPDLVRLQDHYKNSDVVFIGISVDLEDHIESMVKPFLQSQNVNFQNYVQNFKDPADLINLLNEDWRGAVPATFIYDKEGNQQSFLLGKHSFKEFQHKIESIRNIN